MAKRLCAGPTAFCQNAAMDEGHEVWDQLDHSQLDQDAEGTHDHESDEPDPDKSEVDLPVLAENEYLVVSPGGEVEVRSSLPKPSRLPKALGLHSGGDLFICEGRKRAMIRTPMSTSGDDDRPLATRLVMVFIQHRSAIPRTRGLRYVIVTDDSDELLGWIDHSPPAWDFEPSTVRALALRAGLECAIEGFEGEPDFEMAHPTWLG